MSERSTKLLVPARLPGEPPASQDRLARLQQLGYEPPGDGEELGDTQAMLIERQLAMAIERRDIRRSRWRWAVIAAAAIGVFIFSLHNESGVISLACFVLAAFCLILFAISFGENP